jgi:hypothetical protein
MRWLWNEDVVVVCFCIIGFEMVVERRCGGGLLLYYRI